MSIKVSIADDHPMIITGLTNMLSAYKQIEILGMYYNGDQLLAALPQNVPDILLLDIQMPGKKGDELAPLLLKAYGQMRIIALTNFDNVLYVNAMLQHGVQGYLLKTASPDSLVNAIELVAKGGKYTDPTLLDKIKQLHNLKKEDSLNSLTLREKEILQLVVNGATTKEISSSLHLSFYTVENYRAKILLKLDAKNMAELTKKALILGLVGLR
jgi:DNA-binding NarL/FixJ family response regulator